MKWRIFGVGVLLCGCVSNFGDREHAFLRVQNEEKLAAVVVKGKTVRDEVLARFGRPNPFGCYAYHEVSMPLYNFLPTNFFYMKTERRHWEWCVDYNEKGVVSDYRFKYKVEKDERSVVGDMVDVVRKEAGRKQKPAAE